MKGGGLTGRGRGSEREWSTRAEQRRRMTPEWDFLLLLILLLLDDVWRVV